MPWRVSDRSRAWSEEKNQTRGGLRGNLELRPGRQVCHRNSVGNSDKTVTRLCHCSALWSLSRCDLRYRSATSLVPPVTNSCHWPSMNP
jgi:hypothetical protein